MQHIRIVGHKCICVGLCTILSLLGKNSVKTFPQQRRIVGGVVLYAACVIKGNLAIASCFIRACSIFDGGESVRESVFYNLFCFYCNAKKNDRLCGLVIRVLGYRSGGPGSIPSTTKKKVVGLERGPLILLSTNEELLDRKVAAPV
jgi:hypothetical protein